VAEYAVPEAAVATLGQLLVLAVLLLLLLLLYA
jgi:hypothetical protein